MFYGSFMCRVKLLNFDFFYILYRVDNLIISSVNVYLVYILFFLCLLILNY